MEAAICRKKAIAVSYAFFTRNHDPEIIAAATRLSVRLIDYLYKNWTEGVDLYSVNIPLVENVDKQKILWTNMLQNYWGPGSCFQEVEGEDADAEEEEERIRETEGKRKDSSNDTAKIIRHKHKHFKWAPRFSDVYSSVEQAGPGNDGWAVKEGFTRYSPRMLIYRSSSNFYSQRHTSKGKLYACCGSNGWRAEVVSANIRGVETLRSCR